MSTKACGTLSTTDLLFQGPTKYSDGEEYYSVDYKKFDPKKMLLDYDTDQDGNGWFATMFDTQSSTLICRTKYFRKEDWAINQVEYLMAFFKEQYHFEEAYDPNKQEESPDDLSDLKG